VTTVYLHTFGCKANQYDTELVRQALSDAGAEAVADPSEADAAVVNSCTVTHVSESKMRGLVRRLARRNRRLRTVVMGCAAALDDGTLAGLPGVTAVVPGSDPARVLRALGLSHAAVDPVLRSFERGARAWLKVQDGCDEHCTFCATTVARGASRSRPREEIVREARALAARHQEIVITGVHIGGYGRDRPDGITLGALLEYLVTHVDGVRFRLSSIEATQIDDRLAALMAGAPHRLAPHVHAPLQSGSDRILKRMARHWYTAEAYRARLEELARRLPRLGLGADVIVGFPGETARDFEATRAVVASLPLTYAHVFPYSERPDASARRLGGAVDAPLVRERSAALRELVAVKAATYRSGRDGGAADVVLLRRVNGSYQGVTGDYLSVSTSTDRVPPPRFGATLRHANGAMTAELPGLK
jgi:threonylcarbamoyladenosine tRNA methylthiotransferase MtaB